VFKRRKMGFLNFGGATTKTSAFRDSIEDESSGIVTTGSLFMKKWNGTEKDAFHPNSILDISNDNDCIPLLK
jgi:hypothetical protein